MFSKNYIIAECRARRLTLAGVACLVTMLSANVAADDTEVYERPNSAPQMLFVLDVSGSMGWADRGYTGTRLQRLKSALSVVLQNIRGIDVGLMSYTSRGLELLQPVGDVEDNQARLQSHVQSLVAGGGTPTVAALYEASRYFKGAAPYRGTSPDGPGRYISPVDNECQSSHVVLLTDGVPSGDRGVVSTISRQVGSCAGGQNRGGTCGVEFARYLANNDQVPRMNGSIITTHTIGFNINSNWVKDVANAGGGLYRDASSTDDLLAAFRSILDSVSLVSTAAAPSIAVNEFNESRHSDELYYSFFQPSSAPRWHGNIKKYQLTDGKIVDADGRPLLTDEGMVDEDSRSLWATQSDGKEVKDGGFAALQPAARNWYTDTGGADAGGDIRKIKVNSNGDVASAWVNAGSAAERDKIVGFVRGTDVLDMDTDKNKTEPNRFVADSLHNSPLLLSYWAKESSSDSNEVIFTANNMGVLHAIDAETGNEKWSYTPKELLPNIKEYIDNRSEEHVYGLDGNLVMHSTRKATSFYDYEIDDAYLYLSQRRGGRSVIALDVSNGHSTSNPFEVMWKINGETDTEFRNLGQTWATPQVIPVRYGCPDNCAVKEVLMFGGGYNPDYDDKTLTYPVAPSADGHGNAVYFVDLETGELIWSVGNGAHHKLDLPINDSIPETPVPVDIDADGVVDILFFSDVAGHIWRVDLDTGATDADNLATSGGMIASLAPEVGGTKQPLRFFNRLDVVVNGTTYNTATFNLVIGSGMRSSPLHVEPFPNRIYSIRDPWVYTNPVSDELDARGKPVPEYRYVKNDVTSSRDVITTAALVESNGTAAAASSGENFGFYQALTGRGEKILQTTLTHSGRTFLMSYVPADPSAVVDSCNFQLGESRLRILDVQTGTNLVPSQHGPYITVGAGIVANGSIVDTGQPGGADFVMGINSLKVVDLLDPANPNTFRRFYRTGWSELDE